MTQQYEIEAWLGDAAADMTPDQIARFAQAAEQITDQYGGPDNADERDAALSAAHQAITGDPAEVVAELAAERVRARQAELRAMAGLRALASMLVQPGDRGARGLASESGFAAAAGVDRMTVRRDWLGR